MIQNEWHFTPGTRVSLPPSDDGNSIGRAVAWIVIVASVAFLVWSNEARSRQPASADAASTTHPGPQVEIAGRYAIGAHAAFSQSGDPDPSVPILVAELDKHTETGDKLGAVVIVGELVGKDAALKRLKEIFPATPPTPKPVSTGAPQTAPATNPSPDLTAHATAAALEVVYTQGPDALSDAQRATLKDLGWLGEAACTFGKPSENPQRAAILAAAQRTVMTGVIAAVAVAIGLLGGLALLIVLLIRLADRKLLLRYTRAPGGGVFLEAFAIYIGGMAAIFIAAPYLPVALKKSLVGNISLMTLPTLVAIVWPLLRGTGRHAWRMGLGWHVGRGAVREIALGLTGYLAGLPIMAIGFGITFALIKISGATPSHPIEHMIGGGAELTLLAYLLASVYAPVMEETMFRGAFFHGMRSRHGWIISAAITSLIFAAIHPQGWTVIPTLMSIAIVFAAIREWRGTVLSSAAAHCMHNTLALTVVIMMMK